MNLNEYAHKHLKDELDKVENSKRKSELPILTVQEKAFIYKYSTTGYQNVNNKLRRSNGKKSDDFGKHLSKSLGKLPNYEGLVYRFVFLNVKELNKYKTAYKNKNHIIEPTFVSTSKSRLVVEHVFPHNVQFRILSRTGKEIEKISEMGEHGFPNEEEILFLPNRKFRILEIIEGSVTLITLEEVK